MTSSLPLHLILICLLALSLLGQQSLADGDDNDVAVQPASIDTPNASGPAMNVADDDLIAEAVRTELVLAQHVPAGFIDVDVADGIVTLSGEVPTLLGKERARRVVGHLRGVRGIVDRLSVAASEIPDQHVQTAVENALAKDAATDAYAIETRVRSGVVTLTGKVDSTAEAEIAAQVARSIVGVREVRNKLQIVAGDRRDDEEMRADIERRLYWDARIAHELIDVAVADATARLSGTVGSLFERDMVQTRAWVDGVVAVDASALEVAPWASGLRRASASVPDDAEIAAAVADTLAADPRVARFEPQVRVERGVVTLRGNVDNVKAARVAAENASNTYGVVAVDNQLDVRPRSPLTDRDLDRYVTIALDRDAFVTDQPIGVAVDDAVVNLNGSVDSYFERAHAEDVAARMVGVREVENELAVAWRSPLVEYGLLDWDPVAYPFDNQPALVEPLADETIEGNIRRELRWSPYLDSEAITVSVSDGVATLRGTVPSRHALRFAVRSAYRGGALDIDEELLVADTASTPRTDMQADRDRGTVMSH